MSGLKRFARRSVVRPFASRLISLLAPDQATIFMLHRFDAGTRVMPGYPIATLRRTLEHLSTHGYRPIGLDALVEAAGEPGTTLRRRFAVTVDDGYADFAERAWPVFREYDCPVTVFVTTGPIDRQCWFWWDRVEHALAHARQRALTLALPGGPLALAWIDEAGLVDAMLRTCAAVKHLPPDVRDAAIDRLAAEAGVVLPVTPPKEYATLSWADMRRLEAEGVAFGAHTVTHPIIACCDAARARWEMEESTRRLAAELRRPSTTFCFPNGLRGDSSARDEAMLADLGYRAAVSTTPGFVRPAELVGGAPSRRFALPRWSLPDDLAACVRIVSGVDALRGAVR